MFEEPEGATPLDPNEIEGLKFSHITTRGELDELEQANITQGLRWLARQRRGDILDDAFVRQLHTRLFGDVWAWAGSYRLREKNIGIDPLQIAVQLRHLLDDARYWAETIGALGARHGQHQNRQHYTWYAPHSKHSPSPKSRS